MGKRLDQLSTVSALADSDLVMLYDVSEAGSEKTKSITYAEFETQISGAVGGGGGGDAFYLFGSNTFSGTGDIYCNDLYTSESTIHVGDGEIKSTAGNVELYYDNVKTLGTESAGIKIWNTGLSTSTRMYHSASSFFIDNERLDDNFWIRGYRTGSGTPKNLFYANVNGGCNLYYDGTQSLATEDGNIRVYSPSGGSSLRILHDETNAIFRNITDGGAVKLQGEIATDTVKDILVGDPAGATSLYYAGGNKFETASNGMKLVYTSPNGFYFNDQTDKTAITVQQGSSVSLYYNDTLALATTGDGSNWSGITLGIDENLAVYNYYGASYTGGMWFQAVDQPIYIDAKRSTAAAGQITLRVDNAAGTISNGLHIEGGGATSIYYNNEKSMDTHVLGIDIYSNAANGSQQGILSMYSGALYLDSNVNSGQVILRAKNAGGTMTNIFVGAAAGEAKSYYNGTLAFKTHSGGTVIYAPSDNSVYTLFGASGNNFNINHQKPGGQVGILGLNASSEFKGMVFEPNWPCWRPTAHDMFDLGNTTYYMDDIYATNGTIQTSDERAKTVISGTDLGLDFINDLNPVSYMFKDYDYEQEQPTYSGTEFTGNETVSGTKTHHRTHYGLIAQDVETTLSGIGKDTEDFAGFIHSEDSDKYSLRYNEFIAPMIKAIQELSAINTAQAATISGLEARIEALEA